jgi:predicted DNA-binding transcriptional regulator YafY
MATKRKARNSPAPGAVTDERAARLYRLLQLLSRSPQSRDVLTRQLGTDVRGFYRDLKLLRDAGISLPLHLGLYVLVEDVEKAVERLPFPDPMLTLGEARLLAKGRSAAHRKLQQKIEQIVKLPRKGGKQR